MRMWTGPGMRTTLALALAAIMLAGGILASSGASVAQAGAPGGGVMPSRPVVPAQGAPAIQVSRGTGTSAAPAFTGTPPITAQDVRAYVLAHPGVRRGRLIGTPKIGSIDLMTLSQIDTWLNQPLMTLSQSNLYYVVVFDNQAEFVGPGSVTTTRIAYEIFDIFDAYTGNLMMSGGRV